MKAAKTEAVVKVGDHVQDVRLATPKLSDIVERLQAYIDEVENLCEWLSEDFDSEVSKKARLRLKEAIHEMRKLKNGAV